MSKFPVVSYYRKKSEDVSIAIATGGSALKTFHSSQVERK